MKTTLSFAVAFAAAFAASTAMAALKTTPKGFTDDLDAALKRSADNGRTVLAVFSGSDWCIWCKLLEGEILSQDEFLKSATNKYELVFIDNPMDRDLLPESASRRNSQLTQKYGVRGFPTVLALDSSGKVLETFGYSRGGPAKYIAMLDEKLQAKQPKK